MSTFCMPDTAEEEKLDTTRLPKVQVSGSFLSLDLTIHFPVAPFSFAGHINFSLTHRVK